MWSEMKIPQVVVMALNGVKTYTQKQETNGTPQANDNYKIRQIITKIMEYTHTHMCP